MQYFEPPHQATDNDKLDAMVEAIRTGNELPPVVVLGDMAFTGSHRIEAFREANSRSERGEDDWEDVIVDEIPHVEITDEIYCDALAILGIEDHNEAGDWNRFIAGLLESAKKHEADEDVIDALSSQVHDATV